MSKNLKTLICCILALVFVAGTVVAVFADSTGALTEVASNEANTDIDEPATGSDEPASEPVKELKLGDVNFDGIINAADARLTLRISAKLEVPTAEQLIVANVITDNEILANDARLILRVSAKLQPESDFGKAVVEMPSEEA